MVRKGRDFLMSKRRHNSWTTRASNERPWSLCKQSGAPNECVCNCPLGKVVRQDQDISVARRDLFQWPLRCPFPLAAADNPQSLAASVRGCFLTAFFSPHTACTCGTISVRPHSSRGAHDLTSQGPWHQYLRGPFFGRKSITMTENKVFLDNPDQPLHNNLIIIATSCSSLGYNHEGIMLAALSLSSLGCLCHLAALRVSLPLTLFRLHALRFPS
ncbi:hypothetical protein T02_2568 [Trichinella nativa]|uniref:Uncharacterized protein n=1 Tax=Trichinella nativa TaxID=6335 RepID=A0A0V1KKF5_9BILA|nr:hypothetical protein T02_2568 [Trichinella nativa]